MQAAGRISARRKQALGKGMNQLTASQLGGTFTPR